MNIDVRDVRNYCKIRAHMEANIPVFSEETGHSDIADFQRLFTGFYRIRCNHDLFYRVFEETRNMRPENGFDAFSAVLEKLTDGQNKNRVEFSFSSKLVSSLYDDMPIWDSLISRKTLILASPSNWSKNSRILYTKSAYMKLIEFYSRLEQRTDIWNALIQMFDEKTASFEDEDGNRLIVNEYKKIDFVLWSDENYKMRNEIIEDTEIDTLIKPLLH